MPAAARPWALLRGEPVWQAHRSHFYQRLVGVGWSHGRVAVLYLALALVIIPARTVLQERPPAALRGRVIAAQLALANAAAVLPLVVGGALADHLGIRPVMGLLSLLAMGAGAIGFHQVQR